MRKYIIILLTLVLSFAALSLAAKGKQITCSGSTTVLPIAQAAAEAYMDTHPDLNISVRGGGSGVGVAALQNGTVQIANSSRPIKSKEISACKAKGVDPRAYVIANDAIAIVVHKGNAVQNLSIKQIKDIYTGKITNWKQVGGPSLPIVVVSRDVASGTFEVFNEKALGGAKVAASAQLLASNNAVVTAVSTTPGAIGYAGLGYITDGVKVVKVENVTPSETTAKNGTYKLARKLYMYTNGKAKGDVGNFIGWLQSPAGQEIVKQQGFISL
ncbi:MAG TPA: PstS family phosphate ABC transporter substrate-binding protein [Candidatus Cloacimonadota bacterium]|nr:PstS family phosphate ABC transporter substrate-binding protein [Candidatus Cloacimonadota bacterium]HOH79769.1 PstS family phosphate ABC transporter substrate-binding protein [Candidatus Cloacimonadota bacterium]